MSTPDETVTAKVKAWLNDITGDGIIHRITLHHAVEGGGPEILGVVRVSDSDDPFDVVQEIWDMAVNDAESRMTGSMQRYVMVAYRSDVEEPEGQHPFLMNGRANPDLMGGSTEGPNPTGHMGQLMRHTEKLHGSVMHLTEMTAGRLARDLEAERKIRMRLEDERMKTMETVQELADRKHERDLENKREEARQRRHDEMLAVATSMLPLMVGKFLQSPGGPQLPAAGARDEAVHNLLKGLSEAEAMGVMGALKPHNQMTLMELYKAHKEKEEEKAAVDSSETDKLKA